MHIKLGECWTSVACLTVPSSQHDLHLLLNQITWLVLLICYYWACVLSHNVRYAVQAVAGG